MRKFGLAGKSLDHSWSKEYFTQKFQKLLLKDCIYDNYPLSDAGALRDLVNADHEFAGFNITIPYKTDIIEYLDETDPVAAEIGAVNCVKLYRNGNITRLKGFNTDMPAFRETLRPLITSPEKTALILGTGGAAKAVAYALKELKIDFQLISRKPGPGLKTYHDIDREMILASEIIINATPAGMFPAINQCPPLPYSYLTSNHLLYDLIYNPVETLFLKKGAEAGTRVKNGLEMLELQADLSWEIWQPHP